MLIQDQLVGEAVDRTGLEDFGGPLDRLDVLLDALNHEVSLNDFGRARIRGFLVDKLSVRLQMVDAHRHSPELRSQEVVAPVFIVGLPRTGSTLLHHLLAHHPGLRVPLRWEMMRPFPPPEAATYRTDPRIAAETAALEPMRINSPEVFAMHPMRGDFPEECMHILSGEFASSVFFALTGCVGFDRQMRTWDLAPAYEFHRTYLQLLQWKCPGHPWVLKSPMHTGYVSAIDAVYPDARFVWLHRDPLTVLNSWCQLTITMQQDHVDGVNERVAARHKLEEWAWHVESGMSGRDALGDESRFLDVSFSDLVSDPIGEVARISQWCGVDQHPEHVRAMQHHIEEPPYPRGGYRKTPERYALDPDEVGAAFASYRERHGL